MPTDAVSVLCAQLTRDLLAIAKFLLHLKRTVVQCAGRNGPIKQTMLS